MKDNQILELVKENLTNFELFYKKYFKKIYKYCYFRLNLQKESAEDITSQVFLKAIENITKVELKENYNYSLLPWLYTIARNCINEKWRGNKDKNCINLDNELDENIPENDENVENIDNQIFAEKFREFIEKLDTLSKDIIFMKIDDQMTFKDISNNLDISESLAKMRYYRGIKYLTKMLKKS
ncbi:sigma-70 family RNA polymerase sigma factor [Candidatus Dojkabacteria bacterium]|nr:sigma-70 family RNA polymerase sigma factor [Candidatus Dojkabacteria bacterium]